MGNIEIWKDVVGSDGLYMVSNIGGIKSMPRTKKMNMPYTKSVTTKERILKPFLSKGYVRIMLTIGFRKKYPVHVLVAKAFIPNPENKPQVNHLNGVKHDNRIENLEWATTSEDAFHRYRTGLIKKKYGKDHWLSKEVYQYSLNGEFIKAWENPLCASRELGIGNSGIYLCCKGGCKSHKGYIWSYVKLH